MRRILSFVGLFAAAFLLQAALARAGTAVRMDVRALVEGADLALEGRVISSRAVIGPRGRIDTEYVLAVDRTFVGEAQASRAIRLPGGVLPDGRGMIVPGLPRLAVGEDAIVFLSGADASGMRMPVGLAQGRFQVVRDLAGRRRLVRDQTGLELVDPAAAPGRQAEAIVQPADAVAWFDYAAVIAEIEAAAAAKRARAHRSVR